jgi:hypothetical protein
MRKVEPLERERLASPQCRRPTRDTRSGCPDPLMRQMRRLALIEPLPPLVRCFPSTDNTKDALPGLCQLLKETKADGTRAHNADVILIHTAPQVFKSPNHRTGTLIDAFMI